MEEEWKTAIFRGEQICYDVSRSGRLRSWKNPRSKRSAPRILTDTRFDRYGYVENNLSIGGRVVSIKRHVLVLETFVGRPSMRGMQACHSNGDKTDNRVENLRWGTPKENSADSVAHGTHVHGERAHWLTKINEQQAMAIIAHCGWLSSSHLASVFGLSRGHVSAIWRGSKWRSLGGAPGHRGNLIQP